MFNDGISTNQHIKQLTLLMPCSYSNIDISMLNKTILEKYKYKKTTQKQNL